MQDDPRHRLDTAANGLGPGQFESTATVAAGHVDSSQSLTKSNLDRHTRICPPDARDTVAWYLRGLQPGFGTGNTDLQKRVGGGSPQADKHGRPQKQVTNQSPIKINNDDHNVQAHAARSCSIASGTSLPPPLRATTPAQTWTKLIEARKALVASMKSKKAQANETVRFDPIYSPRNPIPTSRHSNHSSTCELRQVQQQPEKDASIQRAESEELIVDPHIRSKQIEKSQEKRKLSDPGSGDRNWKESKHKHAKRPNSRPTEFEGNPPAAEEVAEKDEHRKRKEYSQARVYFRLLTCCLSI